MFGWEGRYCLFQDYTYGLSSFVIGLGKKFIRDGFANAVNWSWDQKTITI